MAQENKDYEYDASPRDEEEADTLLDGDHVRLPQASQGSVYTATDRKLNRLTLLVVIGTFVVALHCMTNMGNGGKTVQMAQVAEETNDVSDLIPSNKEEEASTQEEEKKEEAIAAQPAPAALVVQQNQRDCSESITELKSAPDTTYHVFQFSGTHVASTMAVNLLTGLFEGVDTPRGYLDRGGFTHGRDKATVESNIVTKTHITNVESLTKDYGGNFQHIFFIGNERAEENNFLPPAYCSPVTYKNVVCLEYADIQYESLDELRRVVHYVAEKIRDAFPYFACAELDEEAAYQRLVNMAEAYSRKADLT